MIRDFWRWLVAPVPTVPRAFFTNTVGVPPLRVVPRPPPLWRGGGR